MTPGGIDLILTGSTSADDWWALISEVRQRWPDAIFHRTEPGEMFVYRDQESFQRELSPDEVPHDFIHVLMGPETLTLVIRPAYRGGPDWPGGLHGAPGAS